MRRQRRLLTAAFLLAGLVAPAGAADTRTLATGFWYNTLGDIAGAAGNTYYDPVWSVPGGQTVPTTFTLANVGGEPWLNVQVRSGVADKIQRVYEGSESGGGISGTMPNPITIAIPGVRAIVWPSVEQPLVAARRGNDGACAIWATPNNTYRVYYERTRKVCSATSDNPGTPCTVQGDCYLVEGGGEGEAECLPRLFAETPPIEPGDTPHLGLFQDVGDSDDRYATCGLAFRSTSGESAGLDYEIGTQTFPIGRCQSGGTPTTPAWACRTDADCTPDASHPNRPGGTCGDDPSANTDKVIVPDRIVAGYWNETDTLADANYHFQFNGLILASGVGDLSTVRSSVVPFYPESDSTPLNWECYGSCAAGSHAGELDDTIALGTPDGADYIADNDGTGGGADVEDTLNLSDIDYPPFFVPLSVSLWPNARGPENSNNPTFAVSLWDGTNESQGSNITLRQTGSNSHFQTYRGVIKNTQPGGSAWTIATVNSIRAKLNNTTSSGGLGFRSRLAALTGEIEIAAPALPAPVPLGCTAATSIDGNDHTGDCRFCFTGDSRNNETAVHANFAGLVTGYQHICNCSHGGTTPRGLAINIADVVTGDTAAPFACKCIRGTPGQCHVTNVLSGVNQFGGMLQHEDDGFLFQRGCVSGANDGAMCWTGADCPGGSCVDQAGPDAGGDCVALDNGVPTGAQPLARRCIYGDNIGLPCDSSDDCGDTVAERKNGSYDLVGDKANAYSWCPPGSSASNGAVDKTAISYPPGVCLRFVDQVVAEGYAQTIIDGIVANDSLPLFTIDDLTRADPPLTCSLDPSAGAAAPCAPEGCTTGCTTGDCTGKGTCVKGFTYWWGWTRRRARLVAWRHSLESMLVAQGVPYVDLECHFRRSRRCVNAEEGSNTTSGCLRDAVHSNENGNLEIAVLLRDAVLGNEENPCIHTGYTPEPVVSSFYADASGDDYGYVSGSGATCGAPWTTTQASSAFFRTTRHLFNGNYFNEVALLNVDTRDYFPTGAFPVQASFSIYPTGPFVVDLVGGIYDWKPTVGTEDLTDAVNTDLFGPSGTSYSINTLLTVPADLDAINLDGGNPIRIAVNRTCDYPTAGISAFATPDDADQGKRPRIDVSWYWFRPEGFVYDAEFTASATPSYQVNENGGACPTTANFGLQHATLLRPYLWKITSAWKFQGNAFVTFNTASLPDDAEIQSAVIEYKTASGMTALVGDLVWDAYDYGAGYDSSDIALEPAAELSRRASLTAATVYQETVTPGAWISTTGETRLRVLQDGVDAGFCALSSGGGAASGELEGVAGANPPKLIITYTRP